MPALPRIQGSPREAAGAAELAGAELTAAAGARARAAAGLRSTRKRAGRHYSLLASP